MSAEAATVLQMRRDLPEIKQGEVITGAETLLRCLLIEGVEYVFGYPGGAVLPIYDSLYSNYLKHILTRHEQGAIHAADGYARSTGKTGVCIATSGPGATNLVTGIATAYMDSIPLVVITGNVKQSLIGTDAFQEANIVGITLPITKHNYFVRDVKDLPRIVKEAFHIASTGRPGPVLIDIPKDVTEAKAQFHYPEKVNLPGYNPTIEPNHLQLKRLAGIIAESKKPVIIAGGGVVLAGAHEELLQFAEKTQIPVITTFMGLSGFPQQHPLCLNMPGMHGTYTANQALLQADLVIGIGNRFDDRVTMGRTKEFAPNARIVHIDIDPAEIGKNVETFIPIVGDVKTTLKMALERVEKADTAEWLNHLNQMKQKFPLKYKQKGDKLMPQAVIELISQTTDGNAIITTDVGQHQMWVAQYYKFKHVRSLVSSGGLGTMGFGLPSALGAQIGNPDKTVVAVVGDGGFQMTNQELAVLSQHNIPVKVVIINNKYLGMVRQWQEIFYENRLSEVDLSHSPDFVKLAEAYGVKGWRATNLKEAELVWKEALAHNGPAVIDFVVAEEENVYPMVPSGCTLDQMVMGDED